MTTSRASRQLAGIGGKRRAPGAKRGPRAAILGGVGTFATEALGWILRDSGSRLAGAYPDARALHAELEQGDPAVHVVLLDADDPVAGLTALPEIRSMHPQLKVLMLCEALTPAVVRAAIEQRVEGVVLKSDSAEEMILAYQHILDGRSVMPAGWQSVSLEADGRSPLDSLSAREREVLELAASGMQNREIAERLLISSNTVKFHLRTIYSRLGVRNRVQAMRAIEIRASESD